MSYDKLLWLWSLDLVAHDTAMIQFAFILCILHHLCLGFGAPLPPAVALLMITGYLGLYAFQSCFEHHVIPVTGFFLDGFWDLKINYCSQHVNSREQFFKKEDSEGMRRYEIMKMLEVKFI